LASIISPSTPSKKLVEAGERLAKMGVSICIIAVWSAIGEERAGGKAEAGAVGAAFKDSEYGPDNVCPCPTVSCPSPLPNIGVCDRGTKGLGTIATSSEELDDGVEPVVVVLLVLSGAGNTGAVT
jgi:hypothetical protein